MWLGLLPEKRVILIRFYAKELTYLVTAQVKYAKLILLKYCTGYVSGRDDWNVLVLRY